METKTRYRDGQPYTVTATSTTETAKLLRRALRTAYPDITFRVKSKKYAGGSSVRVTWKDGPTQQEAERITRRFEGASFDGLTDLKEHIERRVNGQAIDYGADYVFAERSFSRAHLEKAAQQVASRYGVEVPPVKETEWGARLDLTGFEYQPLQDGNRSWTVDQMIMHTAHDLSAVCKPRIKLYPVVKEI